MSSKDGAVKAMERYWQPFIGAEVFPDRKLAGDWEGVAVAGLSGGRTECWCVVGQLGSWQEVYPRLRSQCDLGLGELGGNTHCQAALQSFWCRVEGNGLLAGFLRGGEGSFGAGLADGVTVRPLR